MMISLRCIEGFHLDTIEQKFGKDYLLHTKHIIDILDNQGVLEITKDGCSLKKSAKFLADGIASDFFWI